MQSELIMYKDEGEGARFDAILEAILKSYAANSVSTCWAPLKNSWRVPL